MKKLFEWVCVITSALMVFVSVAWAVFIVVVMLSGCTDREAEWQAYSTQHACKIVGRTPGRSSMTTMITNNGVQVIPYNESGISTYQCDNGTMSRRED